MFVLYEMEREIRIDPLYFGLDREEVIRDEINKKFSNRVMLNVGLCMVLWEIVSIGTGHIYQGDGGVHCMVTFRYVVFRPYQDEIIEGKIKNATQDGIQVTLQFFDDIFIPVEGLQYPSKFDNREQIWIWEYKTEEGEDVHEMYMDKGETIRFRVTSEQFFDTTQTPFPSTAPPAAQATVTTPTSSTAGPSGAGAVVARSVSPITAAGIPSGPKEVTEPADTTPKAPYSIMGTINEPGLGLLSWWS